MSDLTWTDLGSQEIFSANLKRYVAASGKASTDVAKAIGVSRGTFSDWMNGRNYPRMDKVQKLAEYFGITMADLVDRPNKLEQQKKELFMLFEEVPEDKRDFVISLIRAAIDNL